MDAPIIRTIPGRVLPAKLGSVVCYFDKIACWLTAPAAAATLAKLERNCGKGGLHVEDRPARFDNRLRQRLELRQPSTPALKWVAAREDAFVNKGEFALDLMFDRPAHRDDAFDFVGQHLCRRWRGTNQEIRIIRNENDVVVGRYDAAGTAPNRMVLYREPFCRRTGELNCLHVEWRCTSAAAMRSAGILAAADLVGFDHRQFWARRFLLRAVDAGRLGRLVRNRAAGTRSKSAAERDDRTGTTNINAYATVQELLDADWGELRIERAVIDLDNTDWLPAEAPEARPLSLVLNPNESPTCPPATTRLEPTVYA